MTGWVEQYRLDCANSGRWACCAAVLTVAVLVVFLPVLGFEFLSLDDGMHVYANRYLQNLTWGNLRHFWEGPHENLYFPLTYTAWAVLAVISRFFHSASGNFFDPWLFHAANLFAHLVASLTVFLILGELLSGDKRAALIGSLVFAVHPVQVEAVAWVSSLRDLFSVCLALMAILFYIRNLIKGGLCNYWVAALPLLAGTIGYWGFRIGNWRYPTGRPPRNRRMNCLA